VQEIHTGTQHNVELAIYKDGMLTNADGNVNVVITDADDNTAITSGSAVSLPPDGIYSFDITPDLTQINRVLQVDWSYVLGGKNATQRQFIEIVTPYSQISDILDYYNIGAKPSDPNYFSENDLVVAERIARTMINNYANQDFGRRYGSQEVFGNGSDAAPMVERMIALDQVWENDTKVIDYTASPTYNNFGFDVELSPTGKTVRIKTTYWDVRYDNQVDPTILYYGRFRDHTRYKFVGQIGYKYVPQDIKLCSLLLVGDLLSNDSPWRTKYLKKVTLAEVGFELAGGAFNGTGNVIVDGILDQYRNLGIVVI